VADPFDSDIPQMPANLMEDARQLRMTVVNVVYLAEDESLDRRFFAMFPRVPAVGEFIIPAAGAAKVVVAAVFWKMVSVQGAHLGVPSLSVRESPVAS
jgi:hypothetical protein